MGFEPKTSRPAVGRANHYITGAGYVFGPCVRMLEVIFVLDLLCTLYNCLNTSFGLWFYTSQLPRDKLQIMVARFTAALMQTSDHDVHFTITAALMQTSDDDVHFTSALMQTSDDDVHFTAALMQTSDHDVHFTAALMQISDHDVHFTAALIQTSDSAVQFTASSVPILPKRR